MNWAQKTPILEGKTLQALSQRRREEAFTMVAALTKYHVCSETATKWCQEDRKVSIALSVCSPYYGPVKISFESVT